MPKLFDAKDLSNKILCETKELIKTKNLHLRLVIIKANNDSSSDLYINNKIKMCEKVGIAVDLVKFSESSSTKDIIAYISTLNNCPVVTAILVQLPLFNHLNKRDILQSIDPKKDVDSLNEYKLGSFFAGNSIDMPLTAEGVIKLLEFNKINLSGLRATVIGRNVISGKSIAIALLDQDCTVTMCHSKTKNLKSICKESDILVCCIGKQIIDSSFIKDNAVVINVGFSKNNENKTCGDIFVEDILTNSNASLVSTIFNSTGLMTTTCLVKRILRLGENI